MGIHFHIFLRSQSPRNGEDLSDGEQELETGIRESSPEGSVTGQVRVKVKTQTDVVYNNIFHCITTVITLQQIIFY